MGAMKGPGRRKRTKWVQLIAGCALLLMLAPYAQQTDRQAWLSKALQVSAAAAEAPQEPAREEMPSSPVEKKSAQSVD
jgi:hypothetical protein